MPETTPRYRHISRQLRVERQPDGTHDVVVRFIAGNPQRYEDGRVITDGGVLSEHRPYRGLGPRQAKWRAMDLDELLTAAWRAGIDSEKEYHDRYNGCPNR